MKQVTPIFFSSFLASLFLISCVPQSRESLPPISEDEPDPVAYESWDNTIYTGPGSTHGIETPRSFLGLGPRKTKINLNLNDQIPDYLKDLNWDAVNARVSNFSTTSKSLCARGTKNTLSTLLGISNVPGDGVDACEVTENYLNQKFSKNRSLKWRSVPLTEIAKTSLLAGDVIVCNRDLPSQSWEDSIPCQSGQWGSKSGHIEFVDAQQRVSSDFRQRGSGCLSNSRYQNARVYRMYPQNALSKIIFDSAELFERLSSTAFAGQPKTSHQTVTSSSVTKNINSVLFNNGTHQITETELVSNKEQDSSAFEYKLYQKQGSRMVLIDQSDVSAFDVLKKIIQPSERLNIARDLVKLLEKEFGKEKLQQKTLNRIMFTSSEKDALIAEGYKIPEFFKITSP